MNQIIYSKPYVNYINTYNICQGFKFHILVQIFCSLTVDFLRDMQLTTKGGSQLFFCHESSLFRFCSPYCILYTRENSNGDSEIIWSLVQGVWSSREYYPWHDLNTSILPAGTRRRAYPSWEWSQSMHIVAGPFKLHSMH